MSLSPLSKGAGVFSGVLAQTALNADVWVQIPTGIDPGSNTAIQLESLEVYFRNAHAAITGTNDQVIAVGISRSPIVPSLANIDCFGMVALGSSWSGTSSGSGILDLVQSIDLEPAITIQPYIYVALSTIGLSAMAQIDYRITYSTRKVTSAEQLLLLASGA